MTDDASRHVTVLACLETAAAVALTVWLAWKRGTAFHIMVSSALAPLLLLRTQHSTRLASHLWQQYIALAVRARVRFLTAPYGSKEQARANTVLAFYAFLVPFAAFGVRFAAVWVCVFRHPVASVTAIPANWFQIAFCMDSRRAPELIPDVDSSNDDDEYLPLTFATAWGVVRDEPKLRWKPIPLIVFIGLWYGPSIIYRWSLKSTTLVYLPLVWAATVSRNDALSIRQRLAGIMTSEIERVTRWYSAYVLIVRTAIPFAFAVQLQSVIHALNEFIGPELVDYWLFMGNVHAWHVARTVSAAITFALFFAADSALRRLDNNQPLNEGFVETAVSLALFVRSLLGVYLAAKMFHIVASSVEWARISWRLTWW